MKFLPAFSALLAALPVAVRAYTNPVLYQDLSDVDLRRVNNTYYMSTSTFHYNPGAPILRSYNLANWEYIGHSVPNIGDFDSKYTLADGKGGYVAGIWASWMIFVPSNNKWYWGGCIGFANTHIYSSSNSDPASSWSKIATISGCQYDSGALLESDGRVYVFYKDAGAFWVAKYAASMTSVESKTKIYTPSDSGAEGLRPYKVNGNYFVFSAAPGSGAQYLLRASSIYGTYTQRTFMSAGAPSPLSGNAFQGALVDTPSGAWYWMSASALGWPTGRVPLLMPITWGSDGWPQPTLSNGRIAGSYSDVGGSGSVAPVTGTDRFTSSSLAPKYEWNHVPDSSKYSLSNGLKLSTATVTSNLFAARNTITQRHLGSVSTSTIQLSIGSMANGDRAGLVYLRDKSAYIGVWKSSSGLVINYVNNLVMANNNGWTTTATGSTVATANIASGTTVVYLRIVADGTVGGNSAKFYYSTNDSSYTQLGGSFAANTDWPFFPGYRYGVFNFATSALGGSVTLNAWDLRTGSYTGAIGGGTVTSSQSTTTNITTTTTTTVTTSSTNTGTCAALYGQCGGIGFTGPTCCAQGKCTYSNDWYSQCL